MERRYANPLSRYWGIHLQKEYNPSDSLTEADHDDDIESPSSGASSSPLSSTLPSSHGQPQSNSSETAQCATTRGKGDEQWSATTCTKFGKWGWFVLFSLPTNLSSLNLMNETWQVVGVETWIKII